MTELFCLQVRHRPVLTQSVEEKHAEFLAGIETLPAPWNLATVRRDVSVRRGDLAAIVKITRGWKDRERKYINYALRDASYLNEDFAERDDFIAMLFRADSADYRELVSNVLPTYIHAFRGYCAHIESETLALEDCEAADRDRGEAIGRISCAAFADRDLCDRMFGLTPGEVVARLNPSGVEARLLGDGVYIVGADRFPDPPECKAIDERIRAAIAG